MKPFACALVTMCLCLWLAGCSGRTEKTGGNDNGKTQAEDESAKKKADEKVWADPKATRQIRGFARSLGEGLSRGVDEAARASGDGPDQAGGPGGVVSQSKVVKDLEKSERLGAFLRAVGVSSGQQQTNDAPPEPEPGPSIEVVSPPPEPELP